MKAFRLICTMLCIVAVLGGGWVPHVRATASRQEVGSQDKDLSFHWPDNVRQWDALILQEAQRRSLDPDFLAAAVWVESKGDPNAISRAGAVGLMQVMPKEAGFSWRPTEKELLNPFTNLYWGTRTLSIVIRQGQGDVFNALAAYNGGWDRTHLTGPRYLATEVLREYATAVALRHEVPGRWVAYFAIRDLSIRGPIWIADSARDDVYFYGAENRLWGGGALIPMRVPTAILARCDDRERNTLYEVGLWLYDADNAAWVGQTSHTFGALMTFAVATVSAKATQLPLATQILPAPVSTSTPPPPPAPTSPPPPAATARPTAAPVTEPPAPEDTPIVTPTLPPCAAEPLRGEAWAVHREYTEYGWKADIFAKGYGGNCQYTYAWDHIDNLQGGPTSESVIFETHSNRGDGVIVGTVLIQSGDEMVEVGVYVSPPD